MDALEDSQKALVDSVLDKLQHYIGAPTFTKERALDYLISLKIVAKESNHRKSAFFNAVLRTMQERIRVADFQFKQFLRALLGDKEDEKMLDSITKVEKTMKVTAPLRGRSQGRGKRTAVRCYACGQFGHYQRFCNFSQAGNPPKRGRFVDGFHEVPKTDPRV